MKRAPIRWEVQQDRVRASFSPHVLGILGAKGNATREWMTLPEHRMEPWLELWIHPVPFGGTEIRFYGDEGCPCIVVLSARWVGYNG